MPSAALALCAALAGCALAAAPVLPGPTSSPEARPAAVSVHPRVIPADTLDSPIPPGSRQMLLVTTENWTATSGRLQRFARAGESWEAVGPPVRIVVGRAGLGWGRGLHTAAAIRPGDPAKREGDGRAPAGVFRLSAAFGYGASEPTGLPYLPTGADTECVDDTASAAYNTIRERTGDADWGSHEEMRRGDELYRVGVVVAHNGPGVSEILVPRAGGPAEASAGGSCIFLHIWRGPASTTAGCTAMPEPDLRGILAWLDAPAEPVLVQLPAAEMIRLRALWGLP